MLYIMSSIRPLPYPTSSNDNTHPCALCSAGIDFNDFHLLHHSHTTGSAEAFNEALMKEPIEEFEHEPFNFFDDFGDFDFEDVELMLIE
jgi:hypothetical protein